MTWDEFVAGFFNGQIITYLLVCCSIIAFAAILERIFALRRRRVIGPLAEAIRDVDSDEALRAVRALSGTDRSVLARIVNVIFETGGNRELVETSGRGGLNSLERRLILLEIVAVISPLLGLLGTVLGMNQVFDAISSQGLGNVRAFSQGIALALKTTIIGLCVAVPAYVAHMMFERRVDTLGTEIEYWVTVALEKYRQF